MIFIETMFEVAENLKNVAEPNTMNIYYRQLFLLLGIILSKEKNICLPGSTECVKNTLRVCDLNGLWIVVDCPNGTECNIKKNVPGCVPKSRENIFDRQTNKSDNTETDILDKLLKITKNRSFIEKLKKRLNEINIEEDDDSENVDNENSSEETQNDKMPKEKPVVEKKNRSSSTSKNSRAQKQKPIIKTIKYKRIFDDSRETKDKEDKHQDAINKAQAPDLKKEENVKIKEVTVTKTVTQKQNLENIDIEFDTKKNENKYPGHVKQNQIGALPNSKNMNLNISPPPLILNPSDLSSSKGQHHKQDSGQSSSPSNGDSSSKPGATGASIGSNETKTGGNTTAGAGEGGSGTSGGSGGGSTGAGGGMSSESGGGGSTGAGGGTGSESSGSSNGGGSEGSGGSSTGSGAGGASGSESSGGSSTGSGANGASGSESTGGANAGTSEGTGSSSTSGGSGSGASAESTKESSGSAGAGSSEGSSGSSGDQKTSEGSGGSTESKESGGQGSEKGSGNLNIDVGKVNQAMKKSGYQPNSKYVQAIVKAANTFKDKNEAAMFLGQTAHETGGFKYIEEIACAGSTKCAGQYGGNKGAPGKSYHGRGFIQLSWPDNYKAASKGLNMGDKLFQNPELAAKDVKIAADTVVWFWKTRVMPKVQDKKKFGLTTKAINGELECKGSNVDKSKKRYKLYKDIAQEIGIKDLASESGCYN